MPLFVRCRSVNTENGNSWSAKDPWPQLTAQQLFKGSSRWLSSASGFEPLISLPRDGVCCQRQLRNTGAHQPVLWGLLLLQMAPQIVRGGSCLLHKQYDVIGFLGIWEATGSPGPAPPGPVCSGHCLEWKTLVSLLLVALSNCHLPGIYLSRRWLEK